MHHTDDVGAPRPEGRTTTANCTRCDHRLSELDEANLLGFFALLARGNLELNGVTLAE